MKKIIFILVFFLATDRCLAQNTPSFRQFYFNPMTFNPAYAGVNGHTELYVAARKQWLNFKDAPAYTAINFLYPTNGRVSFAFSFYEQEVVALRNSVALGTFAYRVPIAENKSLIFGLSGGVGFNNLDLGGADYSNDPTILNAALNTTYADGNFGALLEWGNLRVGFALPKLFGQKYFDPGKVDNVSFSQLRNQNYSASYKVFSGVLSIEPWFLYRMSRDNANSWDAGATVSYKDFIWLGGSYSDAQGIGAFVGVDIKERFRLGYSYEIPAANFTQTSSHEIQLRFRFGKKRDFRWAAKFNKPIQPIQKDSASEVAKVVKQPQSQNVEAKRAEQRDTAKVMAKQIPASQNTLPPKVEKRPEVNLKPTTKTDSSKLKLPIKTAVAEIQKLKPGYYIVTGSFRSKDNARNFAKGLKGKGFVGADVAYNEGTGLYLVFIFYSHSKDETAIALTRFQGRGLKDYYIRHVN